jgi:hypothetical protein
MTNEGRCDEPCYRLTVVDLPHAGMRATRDLYGTVELFALTR